MNIFIKILSAVMMAVCGSVFVQDIMHKNYIWAMIMIGCFFLNANIFRSCLKR